MKKIDNPVFKNLIQIGIVVNSLQDSMEKYTYDYGIGPWYVLEFNPENVKNMHIHGLKKNYSMHVGVCRVGDVRIELIEPIDESMYTEFYNKYGTGLINHLKLEVNNYNRALRYFKSAGIEVLQLGHQLGVKGTNKYAYLSTESSMGFILEITDISSDFIKPEPDYWYPDNNSEIAESIFVKPLQVGIIVKNLKDKIKQYSEIFDIVDWQIEKYDSNNVSDMYIHGTRKDYSMNMAFYQLGNIQIKLIEPVSDSIYSEFYNTYKEDIIHHLKIEVRNYNDAISFFESKGIKVLQSGKYLDRFKYSYIDTGKDLNFIIEIAEVNSINTNYCYP